MRRGEGKVWVMILNEKVRFGETLEEGGGNTVAGFVEVEEGEQWTGGWVLTRVDWVDYQICWWACGGLKVDWIGGIRWISFWVCLFGGLNEIKGSICFVTKNTTRT